MCIKFKVVFVLTTMAVPLLLDLIAAGPGSENGWEL